MSLPVALALLAAAVLVVAGIGATIVSAMVLVWAGENRLIHIAGVAGLTGGLAAFIAGMTIIAGNLV